MKELVKSLAKLEDFTKGIEKLYFVVVVSGFIMKELLNDLATVYCWSSEESANKFILDKFSGKQFKHYSVQALNIDEFEALRHTIKWLPENATVNVAFYDSTL